MPTYVYQASSDDHCARCREPFECRQSINDARLAACPHCQAPVRRVISAPHLATSGPSLSEANVEKHGFTQYRKSEKGVYEKTAGKGPDVISDKGD